MKHARDHNRPAQPALWRRLVVGLLATLALSLQGGAALAHSHGPALGAAPSVTEMLSDAGAALEREAPGQPAPHERGAQCPLCHSPLSHGGILAPADIELAGQSHYSAENLPPPAQAPPRIAPRISPPVRGPPLSI